MIPMDCTKCKVHPFLRKKWGCDTPTQKVSAEQKIPDDEGKIHEYHSCPNLFSTQRIRSFESKYYSIKKGQSSTIPYEKQSNWYIRAVEYYEHWINVCMRAKRGD